MDTAVLLRYLESRSPDAERRAVDEWLATGEAHRTELANLQRAWALLDESPEPATDINALWERIRRDLVATGELAAAATVPPADQVLEYRERGARRRRVRFVTRVVAMAAVVAFAILYAGERLTSGDDDAPVPMIAYEAGPGEISRLTLGDGSRVVVGGSSVLRVPQDYGRGSRNLYLDGEAYFEVGHDPESVFRVHTGRMTIENVGTHFMVVGFAEDAEERVAVAQGAVAVAGTDASDPVVLKANDIATVSGMGPVTVTRGVSVDHHFQWMDGVARFEHDHLAHAARVIQRRFGVEVRIGDADLARRRFTGAVQAATLYEDLRALAILLDADYHREGSTVTLNSSLRVAR